MMTAKFIVEPIKTGRWKDKDFHEQVLLKDKDGYPFAIAHIDLFAGGDQYDELYYRGTSMVATVVLSPLDGG